MYVFFTLCYMVELKEKRLALSEVFCLAQRWLRCRQPAFAGLGSLDAFVFTPLLWPAWAGAFWPLSELAQVEFNKTQCHWDHLFPGVDPAQFLPSTDILT